MTRSIPGKVLAGLFALGASLLVTGAYHLGFAEFQGTEVAKPLFGNGVLTLSYLISANPLATIVSHIGMHVASVLLGIETTVQLPPHY